MGDIKSPATEVREEWFTTGWRQVLTLGGPGRCSTLPMVKPGAWLAIGIIRCGIRANVGDEDLVDPVAIHIDDFEPVTLPFERFTIGRNVPELVHDKAADRLEAPCLLARELFDVEQFPQFMRREDAVDKP